MRQAISRILIAIAAAAIVALAVAAPASANSATVGSALTQTSDAHSCINVCTAVQQAQVGGSSPYPLTSPANGIVTQWAIRSADNVIWSLRILRPAGPNTYTGVGTAVAPTQDPDFGDPILTYPASLPIEQGDAIGISGAGDLDAGVPQHNTPGLSANVMATNPLGQPTDGTSAGFTPDPGHELLLQATVKFCSVPDLKRLKKKSAKKRLAASDCGVKVKKRPTHKRKFRGKVLKQKKPAGTTAPPGTVIPIVIGKKT